MLKFKEMVLMLCLTLSGALCYANGAARTENEKGEGILIEIKEKINHGGSDRSNSIISTLDGHVLTVVFTENLGQVAVEITTASGVSVQYTYTQTPNGVQCYIPNAGDYVVTFTLSDGDEYYGEFRVTD